MKYIIILILLGFTISGFTQNKAKSKDVRPYISGKYKTVMIGMTREEVLDNLKKDVDLEVDVETDYGDFDEEQRYLVKAKRLPFIEKIYYQFTKMKVKTIKDDHDKNEKWILYAIIIHFNPKYNNFNSLYERILSKYGEPDARTSIYALWKPSNRQLYPTKDGREIQIKLILNHPGTIKIIDETTYQRKYGEKKEVFEEAVKTYQREVNERLIEDFIPSETDEKKDAPK
ncbi:MAG: hypothetical protein OEV44_05275 [Spirochaetota bacterium]|nr:hypothetical protein [Spirochaetota bacterium]